MGAAEAVEAVGGRGVGVGCCEAAVVVVVVGPAAGVAVAEDRATASANALANLFTVLDGKNGLVEGPVKLVGAVKGAAAEEEEEKEGD